MPPSGQAGLKRELGLRDLVLTQILFVVGLTNMGNFAKLGASHVVFWLTAIVLFYIPQAMGLRHGPNVGNRTYHRDQPRVRHWTFRLLACR